MLSNVHDSFKSEDNDCFVFKSEKLRKMSQNSKIDNLKRCHDALYSNINFLTFFYPPSSSMKVVFNKTMFLKNNKTAFQEISYYLLTILEPKLFQKNKIFWPLIDNKTEIEFRKLVSKFLNELTVTYPDAHIPKATTSHLISPGGYKFTKLMFKVSKLVLEEHLKRNMNVNEHILGPFLHDESLNTSNSIDLLNSLATKNFDHIKTCEDNLNKEITAAKIKAKEESEEKLQLETVVILESEKLIDLEIKANDLPTVDPKKLKLLESKVELLENIQETVANCLKLHNCLLNNHLLLEYKKSTNEKTKSNEEDLLNLIKLYEEVQNYLKRKKFNTQITTKKEVQQYIDLLQNNNEQFKMLQDRGIQIREKLMKYLSELTGKTKKGENENAIFASKY